MVNFAIKEAKDATYKINEMHLLQNKCIEKMPGEMHGKNVSYTKKMDEKYSTINVMHNKKVFMLLTLHY